MWSDPIADMLTRIRNAVRVKADKVDVPASRLKLDIAKILKEEGFIRAYKILKFKKQGMLRLNLKYNDGDSIITDLQKVSKAGRRVYVGKDDIPRVMGGVGISIVSTSRGVLSDRGARREGVGGEVICKVW
jgi:small subunit ribosomal protein S8